MAISALSAMARGSVTVSAMGGPAYSYPRIGEGSPPWKGPPMAWLTNQTDRLQTGHLRLFCISQASGAEHHSVQQHC